MQKKNADALFWVGAKVSMLSRNLDLSAPV